MLRLAWLMMLLAAAPVRISHAFVPTIKNPSRRAVSWMQNVPCPTILSLDEDDDTASTTATTATWKWCTQFVLAHNLCPWATASVASASSVVRIYTLHQDIDGKIEKAVQKVSTDLQDLLNESNDPGIHSKAIFFLIFGQGLLDDFGDFYDFYCRLEDAFLETNESITLAPFHPCWQFEGDDNNALDYEKRSPVPTISFVSTQGIDQGGATASSAIATANQKTLSTKSAMEWKAEWNRLVLGME